MLLKSHCCNKSRAIMIKNRCVIIYVNYNNLLALVALCLCPERDICWWQDLTPIMSFLAPEKLMRAPCAWAGNYTPRIAGWHVESHQKEAKMWSLAHRSVTRSGRRFRNLLVLETQWAEMASMNQLCVVYKTKQPSLTHLSWLVYRDMATQHTEMNNKS